MGAVDVEIQQNAMQHHQFHDEGASGAVVLGNPVGNQQIANINHFDDPFGSSNDLHDEGPSTPVQGVSFEPLDLNPTPSASASIANIQRTNTMDVVRPYGNGKSIN